MKILRIGILLAFYLLLVSCDDIKTQSREKYLSAETIEDAQIEAEKVRELGAEGIPIFLEAIEKHIDSQDSLLSYGIMLKKNVYIESMQKYLSFHVRWHVASCFFFFVEMLVSYSLMHMLLKCIFEMFISISPFC
jgi:hypothetical protein